ncbi:MAG TPA: hypothetical protein VF079_05315 [Sphingomicrobium sp.]
MTSMSAILGLVALAAASSQHSATGDGIAVAKRLVAAIRGEAQFQDGDFATTPGADDKAALRRFARCKVELIDYTLLPDPEERDTYVHNPNSVLVAFGCRGVPSDHAAGLTLHLKDGKIGTIETHNADLVKAR